MGLSKQFLTVMAFAMAGDCLLWWGACRSIDSLYIVGTIWAVVGVVLGYAILRHEARL